ncbi:adenylate/guanylate cyclase domain-containing protein [Rhizobium oryzihabitans]|uniref:adenylate/guanylate cyclase domain-containing protein n=1 Tax=Rhizobium oryzihabitans TaxID=2267833 RepID=UPI004035AB69
MKNAALTEIKRWLVSQGLLGRTECEILVGFCEGCRRHGIMISQGVLFIDTLHPVLESWGFFWDEDEGVEQSQQQFLRDNAEENAQIWLRSPFYAMQQAGQTELRVSLRGTETLPFLVLNELRDEGQTDYFAMIQRLCEVDTIGEMDNLYSRWSSKSDNGFSEGEVEALRELLPTLALSIKTAAVRRIAQSLVSVYLGRDPGRRVLQGRIARGAVDSIHTVLWFSDMADYTSLSEQVASGELIGLLNDYSEAAILSVTKNGGDVLKLIGDGTLAIFNAESPETAAQSALAARRELEERLQSLNRVRWDSGQVVTSIYLSLHVGEVFYGNIGSCDRLDFTVIGPAVNEVCRIASICNEIGRPLVISSAFRSLLPIKDTENFFSAGFHRLKGVRQPMEVYAEREG